MPTGHEEYQSTINTTLGNVTMNDMTIGNVRGWQASPHTVTDGEYEKFYAQALDKLPHFTSSAGTETKTKKKGQKMAKKTRGLYQVILVDPKEGKIIFNEFVICSKPEDVLLEAGAGEVIKDKGLQVSEVDKILNYLGEIRRTKKNKDGIVELVEEKEDN